MLAQQLLNGVVIGSIYALFALGFTLVFGVNRILNLAHGAIFMWGAFAGLYAIVELKLPLAVAIILAALTGGCLSVVVDRVAFRPLRARKAVEFAPIISSIGAGLILISLAQQISQTKVMRFPFGTFPIMIFELFGLRVQLLQLIIIGTVLATVLMLTLYLYKTSLGRQIRAVAVSEQTAQLLGINPSVAFLQIFLISGALAGIAGVLIGLAFNSVHFLMGEPLLLRAFVVIVLGGLGSIAGAVVAGLILGIVQALSVAYFSSGAADAIIFCMLFLILVIRPTGLFGGSDNTHRVVRR